MVCLLVVGALAGEIMADYLEGLKGIIQKSHGSEATHVETGVIVSA
jgi:hypothetical protein